MEEQKPKIIVVDDETSITDVAERLLSQKGYDIKTTNNPLEAIEIIKKEPFDIAIIDLKMPQMDGIQLLDHIKSIAQRTEIIIMTGYATVDTAIAALRKDVSDYILKPFNIQDLEGAVEKTLLIAQLKSQLVSLTELNKFKDEFMACLSHDLKNPIMAIYSSVDLMARLTNENEKLRLLLSVISRQTDKMKVLVCNVLDSARIDSQGIKILKTINSAFDILQTCVEEMIPIAEEKKIKIKIQEPIDKSCEINCDRPHIERVIINLLSNAIKYSNENGEIYLWYEKTDKDVIFYVKDSGFGIPIEDQEKIFEKFYRVKSHENKAKGTGLGLAICKMIVERHNGKIWVESKGEGEGSKFIFTIPN